jgi:hypothetical protein
MKIIDPTYLRTIYDGLNSGAIHKDNASALPAGLVGMYEAAFPPTSNVNNRKKVLDFFAIWALLPSPVGLSDVAIINNISLFECDLFINKYSKYFNKSFDNKYFLYNERLKLFFLQRTSQNTFTESVKKSLINLPKIDDEIWLRENICHFYALNNDFEKLYIHLITNKEYEVKDWWIQNMRLLLDGLNSENVVQIDYTNLAELLRLTSDFICQRKGSFIIVKKSNFIDWENLESFFHTTSFQYELSWQFSRNQEKLPNNWLEMTLNESHPLSYTFSYVFKYSQFFENNVLNESTILKLWFNGSPYSRIIVIMIWGYRALNNKNNIWLDNLLNLDKDWEYLKEEKKIWTEVIEAKNSNYYAIEFEKVKKKIPVDYHYILNSYWDLLLFRDRLLVDIRIISLENFALDLAYWIYQHPLWEIGLIANEILINQLRNRELRNGVLEWLDQSWKSEEFYALGQVIFEIKKQTEESDFFRFFNYLLNSKSCQIRGSFISDIINYIESNNDTAFAKIIANEYISKICQNATDIWEIQELLRLIKLLLNRSLISRVQYLKLCNLNKLLIQIDDPLDLDFNNFWKQAELIKKFNR